MTEHAKTDIPNLVEHDSKSQRVRRIPLALPVIDAEMRAAALSVLDNEKMVMGESVYKFEEEFADYCGTKYAVSTASGTAALSITFEALGIGPGHEVVTTPFSFIATANAVIHAGADPVFADVEDEGFNLSASKSRLKISQKIRAVMPVHLYGHPANMSEFQDLASEKGIGLIEDACQAHGAEFAGRKVGSIGDAGCFSFYPAKNMTVGGDGGMITTNDEELAVVAGSIRDCGRNVNSKYHMGRIGYTSRLNSVNAAIGRVQLRSLNSWTNSRRRVADWYRRELDGVEGIALPPTDKDGNKSVYHLFVIRSPKRESVKRHLEAQGIETGVHYPLAIHLQTPYRQRYGFSDGTFPLSESFSNEVLSLPIYPTLEENEVVRISETVKASLKL